MGILLASDHITGANGGNISRGNQLKGDLFALLGATFYGMSNVAEEFLVSKRPLYEVVGQLGFWGMITNGTQAGIFDRASFRAATWNGKVAGYIVGYTLCLTIFYSLAPLVFRLASAAFFNISLLTGNFWFVQITPLLCPFSLPLPVSLYLPQIELMPNSPECSGASSSVSKSSTSTSTGCTRSLSSASSAG